MYLLLHEDTRENSVDITGCNFTRNSAQDRNGELGRSGGALTIAHVVQPNVTDHRFRLYSAQVHFIKIQQYMVQLWHYTVALFLSYSQTLQLFLILIMQVNMVVPYMPLHFIKVTSYFLTHASYHTILFFILTSGTLNSSLSTTQLSMDMLSTLTLYFNARGMIQM